jgi:hypothetical protein
LSSRAQPGICCHPRARCASHRHTLENNAISFFTGAATAAADGGVKEPEQFLAGWEKQHREALRHLCNSVRQDFVAAGSFSAF